MHINNLGNELFYSVFSMIKEIFSGAGFAALPFFKTPKNFTEATKIMPCICADNQVQ